MARTTVEDCFSKVSNKFELSVLAAFRAKQISKGSTTTVDRRNDKNSVIALREVASEHVEIPTLKRAYVQSLQLCLPSDDVIEGNNADSNPSGNEVQDPTSLSDELIENEFISVDEDDVSNADIVETSTKMEEDISQDDNSITEDEE